MLKRRALPSPISCTPLARVLPLTALCLGVMSGLLGASLSQPQDAPDPAALRAALPAPEAPPALSATDKAKLDRVIKKLTSKKTKARLIAEQGVLEFGRAAIPILLEEAKTTSTVKQASIQSCLVRLADMRDWDLVEAQLEATPPAPLALRRFAARKAGELQLLHLIPQLEPLLEDGDTELRLEAAVGLASLGTEAGLGALAEVYTTIYRVEQGRQGDEKLSAEETAASLEQGERIRQALAGLADHGRHEALSARLKVDPKADGTNAEGAALDRQSAIALLEAIGDRQAVHGIARALDDSHNIVQREAINALRQLVEQAEPFSGGSIFQQINEVKRLKDVLARR